MYIAGGKTPSFKFFVQEKTLENAEKPLVLGM